MHSTVLRPLQGCRGSYCLEMCTPALPPQVRPAFACRLAGTLAEVIARGEREKIAAGILREPPQDRRADVVDLLRYAYQVREQ